MMISAVSVEPPSFSSFKRTSSWKETALISAVALAALATFVQVLVGSTVAAITYALIGGAAYLGYLAEQALTLSIRQQEYYDKLHKNAEKLEKERVSFHVENKKLTANNTTLKGQLETLQTRLQEMESLLVKMETSAALTQELLTSCIDVSSEQKHTERRIADLLNRLEKLPLMEAQKQMESHLQNLDSAIQSMGKQIAQFFLHDAKAANLLEVKQEFLQTSEDLEKITEELERVQKELSMTSKRLDETSKTIDRKLEALKEQEIKLQGAHKLTRIILQLVKNPELKSRLSYRDKKLVQTLRETVDFSGSSE
jgi:DNA repair exonuclease SbcCD ATPase subunit